MKMNKKRKGFTLIELIAVIAILGILALIVVPKISGYTNSAKKAKERANAKAIMNTIEIYNANANSPITDDTKTMDDITGGTSITLEDVDGKQDMVDTITKVTGETNSGITGSTTISSLKTMIATN